MAAHAERERKGEASVYFFPEREKERKKEATLNRSRFEKEDRSRITREIEGQRGRGHFSGRRLSSVSFAGGEGEKVGE